MLGREKEAHSTLTCMNRQWDRTLDNADASRPDDRVGCQAVSHETVRQTLKKTTISLG